MVADNADITMLEIRIGLYVGNIRIILCPEAAFFYSFPFAIDLPSFKNIAVCPAALACYDYGHIINPLNSILFEDDYTMASACDSCTDV